MNIRTFFLDDSGQALVEYALILALVSIIAIASLTFMGNSASNKLSTAGNALS